MDSSPLMLGYDYARAASIATQSSDTVLAFSQHALAAGEFSKAASGTSSTEAMRTLKLLEQHHHRLSELLRTASENTNSVVAEQEVQTVPVKRKTPSVTAVELQTSKSDLGSRSSSPHRTLPVLRQPRRPPRDLSSSIASNLATARGIPANYTRQPLSPSISKHQAPGNLEVPARRDGKRYSVPTIPEYPGRSITTTVSSPIKHEIQSEPLPSEQLSNSDEGFSRFYTTFENILSKLSAPLAFAGLPLVSEETTIPNSSIEPKTSYYTRNTSKEQISTDEIDLTKHFSRAALRASAREDYGANDSFYVVPTTGHTVSYAQILSFDQKEKRRMAVSTNADKPDAFTDLNEDDDFVDARETPMPLTPQMFHNSGKGLSSREKDNKIEELTMENSSLKTAIDKLSKRLHAFEISAQYNSMALAESMRLMRDFSPSRKVNIKGSAGEIHDDESLKQRLQELEGDLRLGARENESLKKENEKLKGVVTRYRERWEKLKEGAKSRRDGREGGMGDAPSNTS